MREIIIKKAIRENYVSIWEDHLNAAIKNGEKIKISVLGPDNRIKYCGVDDPSRWKKTAIEVQDKIYHRPDEPMRFYYNFVRVMNRKEIEDAEAEEFARMNY